MTQPLSPAAQAVLDAYINAPCGKPRRTWVAAALRAAADQVVPPCSTRSDRGTQRMMIRHELLAIAAELEGGTRDPLEPNDLSHLSEEEFQALAPQGYHGV